MPSIRDIYTSKDFLQYSGMKSVLKVAIRAENAKRGTTPEEIKFTPMFNIRDRTSRSQRVAIFFERFALNVKFFFNRSSKKKFNAAVVKIANAYFTLNRTPTPPRKTENKEDKKPSVKEDPIKVAESERGKLIKKQEDLQLKITEKTDELMEIQKLNDELHLVDGLELNKKKDELKAKEAELPLLKDHLKDVKAYVAPTGFLSSWKSDPAGDKIKKFNPHFDFTNIPAGIIAVEEQIKKLEEEINQHSTEVPELENEVKNQRAKSEELTERPAEVTEAIIKLQTESGELAKSLITANEHLDVLRNAPPPEPIKEPVKEEPKYNFGTPEENLAFVLDKMKKSIYSSVGTESEKDENWQRHQRYLTKGKQTDALKMSGIRDEELAKKKVAMAVRILATALSEPENNAKLCEAVAGFLDSLLKLDPSIPEPERYEIKQLVKFVFGLDENQQPRMDEDFRLRGLACINGCVLVMAQYFFDEKSLTPDMQKIKHLESPHRSLRIAMKGIAKVAFYYKKDELMKSIRQVPVLQNSPKHKESVDGLVNVLVPVVLQILSGDPKSPTELKKKIHAATEKFANEDFKKFIDLIDFEKVPSTTEITDACCELFKNFERNLDKAAT